MCVAKISQKGKIALLLSVAGNIPITEKIWMEIGFAMCGKLFQAIILLRKSKIFKILNACSKN